MLECMEVYEKPNETSPNTYFEFELIFVQHMAHNIKKNLFYARYIVY